MRFAENLDFDLNVWRFGTHRLRVGVGGSPVGFVKQSTFADVRGCLEIRQKHRLRACRTLVRVLTHVRHINVRRGLYRI